ncbi:hypothetical protein PV08_08349 [Exophiala spinifera]|uniref:Thioesterase domain-containing protein n=1 Tax=Exophiala spinifera TaxID=91928 RepID=A0A0D1ZK11_9EURO|nr:uncharacterized protein PV08_08349 [Exophiala spinifera]KIW13162.1 hypothetical protein PV08_08349 [Exophiala spinifera]
MGSMVEPPDTVPDLSDRQYAYFNSVPWCAALLADKRYTTVPSRFGQPSPDTRGDFFTRTLATDNTIVACLYQERRVDESADPERVSNVEEIRAFFATASGVNGFPGVAHGGFVAAVIDETMGYLIKAHLLASTTEVAPPPGPEPGPKAAKATVRVPLTSSDTMTAVMTGELTIRYKRPVPTGEALLVRTWVERVDGRKTYAKAVVEDGEGTVLTEGVSVFISLKDGKSPSTRRRAGAAKI